MPLACMLHTCLILAPTRPCLPLPPAGIRACQGLDGEGLLLCTRGL
jgi:hypothetical protein